ncbi:SCO family protein [Endozoicomonas sp. SM1973]|uniref:SCO family protein n=1 Tax=Spartinivicinus marinus TaxID=2994442 RepID=A0A853I2V3_9GAMM|nr:SCO family protein [Spartinivicinus marinus]MCX4026700.1 SCO family protein [Spartinivicinus marinus]NYZ64534.1 SCO family protein [Spartinivicinus marinus]
MSKNIKLTVVGCIVFIILCIALLVNKVTSMPLLSPEQLQLKGTYILKTPRTLSEINLTSHDNKAFTNKELKGKWTVMFFGYTSCPDICPTTLTELKQLKLKLSEEYSDIAEQINYVFVSVDPGRDSIEQLSNYVPYFDKDFLGVTGDLKSIYNFANQLNIPFSPVVNPKEENYLVDHSGNLIVINPMGDYHAFIKPPLGTDKLVAVMSSIVGQFN